VWGGGALTLLLPAVVFSFVSGGLEFSHEVTDNLYLLASKETGQVTSIGPFIHYESLLDLRYEGRFSVIEFDWDRLSLDNSITLEKRSFLPGVGNRNTVYGQVQSFFPTGDEIHRYTNITLGDSLSIYLGGRYRFTSHLDATRQIYHSDSLTDYTESGASASIAIPLPYVFITPHLSAVLGFYGEDRGLSYGIGTDLEFPLTIDWSFLCSFVHHRSGRPADYQYIPASYVDDSFSEADPLRRISRVKLALSRLFLSHRSQVTVGLDSSVRDFFDVEDVTRRDRNLSVSANFTKSLNDYLYVSTEWESSFNSSTTADFDYTENRASVHFGLTF
jgi:hypothetical protein